MPALAARVNPTQHAQWEVQRQGTVFIVSLSVEIIRATLVQELADKKGSRATPFLICTISMARCQWWMTCQWLKTYHNKSGSGLSPISSKHESVKRNWDQYWFCGMALRVSTKINKIIVLWIIFEDVLCTNSVSLVTFKTVISCDLPGSLSLTPRNVFSFIWTGWGVLSQSNVHLRPLAPPYSPSANERSPYIVCNNSQSQQVCACERLSGLTSCSAKRRKGGLQNC